MALLKWYEEEEKQEEDSLNSQPTTKIASVQDSWQPTAQGGDEGADGAQQPQQDNYLMSDQKAQADFQLQQRREAEAAAKAEAARQAAIARENDARARAAAEAAEQAQAQQPKEYKPKDAGEAAGDFFQGLAKGLWKGSAGALGSGASFISSLISGDADNDVTNATKQWQKSADDWGAKVHADGIGDLIGSVPGGIVSGLVDPASYMVRGVRNTPEMIAANIAAGSGDKYVREEGIRMQKELQAKLFGDDVAKNGDGAMLMEGVAKPGAMILNVVTAGRGSASVQVSKPVWQRIAASAAKEGIVNIGAGVPLSVLEQAARGQEITWESVGKDALVQGALGATVGGASQGYAISKNRGGMRDNANLLEQELTPVERAIEEVESRPVELEDGNVSFEQSTTEAPVADGVVTPVSPDAPEYTPVADNLTPVVDEPAPQPLTEAPDQLNGQTPPDWDEVTAREVAAAREQPAPESAPTAPVADGTAQAPTIARPVEDMPTIPTEQVRALQEARAGTSQAEEAVINQRLQELAQDTPSVYRSEDPERYGIGQAELGNGLYTGSKETAGRRKDGTISEEGLYEYKVNPEAKVLDSSSDEFSALDSRASTHPSLKEPGISDTEWRNRKTALLGQYVREAGYDGVKRGTNQFVGMSERALIPVTEGAPTYRSEPTLRDEAPTRQLDDEDRPSALMPEYLRGEPSNMLRENSRISKIDAPKLLRESGLDETQVANVMSKLYKNNKGASYGNLLRTADREAGFDLPNDTLTDATATRESDIADNIHIRELDNSLETIMQRRAQLIADGRSENYHGVKQLDKAADAIIREQEKIADSIRRGDDVLADKGTPEWERQRNQALATTERVAESLESGVRVRTGKRIIGTSFAKGYRQNTEVLKNSSPNIAYEIDPKTGKVRQHESSEILAAFARSIGEDLPPIIIGNTPKQGAGRRLDTNTAGANATYSPSFNRLDYKEKRSVYHETVHHIDHFIEEYRGDNPKMLELQQLRKEITPEEVRKYQKVDSSADNVYEYVAHAMDLLLDGRLKKGELGAGVLKYVKAFFTQVRDALSSAHVYGRQGIETVKYIKELDRAIHEIDVTKMPKQKPLSPEDLTPTTSNLPPKMQPKGKVTPVKAPAEPKPKKTVSEWAKRVYSQTDLHKDMKRRLAVALGKEKDAELEIGELLSGTKVSGKDKAAIIERYNRLETLSKEFNKLMQGNRKLFQADTPESIRQGISQLDEATSRKANKLIDAYGRAERDLNGYIRKVQGQKSLAHRGVNALQNVTGARNASLLSSVGGIERNISQELGANLLDAVMHPVKYVKGMPQLVPEVLRSYKRAFREYTVKPKTLSEVLPYTIGNTYRVLMSPVTGQANYRKSVMRETLAESLLRAEGLDPTRAEIKKFAGSMGADSEVVANNLAGIMNGMTSHTNGLEVMQNYQEFIHTGSAEAKETFMRNAERSSNLAAKLSRVGAESDNPKVRAAASLMNIVMPFVTTASNMAKTAVTYNLNPMARSVPDEVLKAVRSNPANALTLLKANAVKGGVLASVYGLYAAGIVQYNNGDEVDKPRGISIDLGNGEFFPVRGTPIEVPIAAVVTAAMLADDVADGKVKNWSYYGGILGNSLPYIDSTNNIAAATVSALDSAFSGDADQGTGDNGYAAKSYAVNMAKSFVPYSNNGVQAGISGWQGKSTNAKSTYDKDMGKWFSQSVRQAYDPAFRDSLKDSRDASGRVRTVDQQGGFRIQKGINDELTKVHNDSIDNLVKYGRDNGLGKDIQAMFNTYDTGKNNNFKSIQDTITFLDVEEGANGKKSPKAEDKLKDNEKLADLAAQIRDGFWGETGDNLLMVGDQQLYSDVSVPNKNGTKNSRLPISMQSIKNAIAATDLPEEQRDRMYEISQANQALYDRRKAGEISYDQEQAMKAANEQEYIDILSNSENYKKLGALMSTLDEQGFFAVGGLGSTKAGQTYLWNSLNALLGSKGATPAAQWDSGKSFTPYGRGGGGSGRGATHKPGDYKNEGIKWTPVGKRQMATVKAGKYTPVDIKVKLGNAVKKNKTQNYSDRSF